MMTWIQKYASPLSLLAVLSAACAAPYLIPENPDSLVFRSGTLGLLLLLGCFVPLRDAFARADGRRLTASLAAGYLFALALGVGSELYIYSGLLRGLGSFIRRMAVPVMAAPLFGGLCCRLSLARLLPREKPLRLPMSVYALIIFLFWLPLLTAYFPGMLNYDFRGEYEQHILSAYTNAHPLLHSALINGVITLGEALHSRTFGVLLYSLMQMALFALSLGFSCAFVQKRGAPSWALILLTALYALHPVFSVMALSMTKDTLFAGAILVLSLLTWTLIETPQDFKKRHGALYVLCIVSAALLRNNGVFALALLLPGAFLAARGLRRMLLRLIASGAALSLALLAMLNLVLSPQTQTSFQLYSLPAQQLVRAYNAGSMSKADKAEIAAWYIHEDGLKVHPHLADSAKGYLDRARIQEEGGDFLALWKKHAASHGHEYLEAFLMLNVGSWYPDDLSHSTIYPDVSWNDKGYLQTQEYDMSEYGIHTSCHFPALRDLFERICRRNAYQKYPVVSVLFCTATPFWVLLLACAILIGKRRHRLLPAALGCFGLFLSYLLGPCTLPRYTLSAFCLAPVLLILALILSEGTPRTQQ